MNGPPTRVVRRPSISRLCLGRLAIAVLTVEFWGVHAWDRPAAAASTESSAGVNTAARAEPWVDASTGPELYLTGMVGSSLAGRAAAGGIPARGLLSGGLPTGEGALGVAIPRPGGALRLEFEARGGDEWSTMANIWRDISVTERFGTYLGGGVGAGGGPVMAPAPAAAAGLDGQLGVGVTYAVNERITFDVGYRFHAGRLAAAEKAPLPGGRLDPGAAALAGSEVLLSVRLYDPFRGWLR
jgi:hypothetical protein